MTPPPLNPSANPFSGMSLRAASVGLGITSILFSCLAGFGLLPGIASVVCGHMAKRRSSQTGFEEGRGTLKLGLILGYAGIVLSIIYIITIGVLLALDVEFSPPPGGG